MVKQTTELYGVHRNFLFRMNVYLEVLHKVFSLLWKTEISCAKTTNKTPHRETQSSVENWFRAAYH